MNGELDHDAWEAWQGFKTQFDAHFQEGDPTLKGMLRAFAGTAAAWRPSPRMVPEAFTRFANMDTPMATAVAGLLSHDDDERNAYSSLRVLTASFAIADLYWTSPDLVALTEVARNAMLDDDVWLDTALIPGELHTFDDGSGGGIAGLIVLGTPVAGEFEDALTDIGAEWPVNAYYWLYIDVDDDDHDPLLLTVECSWNGTELFPLSRDYWFPTKIPADSILRRRLLTLFTLAGQERTVEVEEVVPDRPTRRRLERAGHKVSPVKVIDLRHPKGSSNGGTSSVEWSHRWMVSGHWRNQWVPSRLHRLQWIHPYVKGPDDKPLVVKDTVKVIR